MRRRPVLGLAGCILLGVAPLCSGATPFQEGMWETTMETTMEGLPMAVPPTVVTTRQCVTQSDLVPKPPQGQNCTFTNVKRKGGKVSWEFTCNQDGATSTGRGEITYSSTASSGTMTVSISSKDGDLTARTKMKGKRVGACTGEAASMTVNGQDMRDIEARANQAKQTIKEHEMQNEANRKEFVRISKQVRIPKEKAGGCERGIGENGKNACDESFPPLAIKAGLWEVTTETTSRQLYGGNAEIYNTPAKSTVKSCLSPVSEPVLDNNLPRAASRRSGNTVTWNGKTLYGAISGGVEYRGDSFEGGSFTKGEMGENYTKVTGRRIGDGDCIAMERSSRRIGTDTSSRKIPSASESGSGGAMETIKNPVKKLRSIFGF